MNSSQLRVGPLAAKLAAGGVGLVASACAFAVCPPELLLVEGGTVSSNGEQCPAFTTQQSDTPDYEDALAFCSGLTAGRSISVSTASALQDAIANAACGDVVRLEPGTYGGTTFTVSKSCPATSPITIQGAPGFQSSITSAVDMTGANTILAGVLVKGPNAQVKLGGQNNKVIGNRFTDWRGVALAMVSGDHGEVAYNEFFEPHPWLASEEGGYPLRMGIRTTEKDASTFHYDAWIHHNHFHDFPGKPNPNEYHSGQSDAIEMCETPRPTTISMKSGWYIERNVIERHLQGNGIVDLKCGGAVVRYNTVLDSPDGRLDLRSGTNTVLESNWMERSGGTVVHGGNNKIVGNFMRNGNGIVLASGDLEWDEAGTGHSRAYKTLVAGNDTNALHIGKSYSEATSRFPVKDTVVEGHRGSTPVLDVESNTVMRSATSFSFVPPFKLTASDVGPGALERASASYLQCRMPGS